MRALLLVLLVAACTFPTPRQQQRAHADSMRPAPVKTSSAPLGPIRKLRVRAYADAGYRAQTPRWNARIEEQISRATSVLVDQFGIELEVESIRPWSHSAGDAASLQEALAALREMDPGGGVDWVVGFAEPLRAFSATQEELGMACMFCRHFVVRGMFSAAETDAIDRALPMLSSEEREALGRERRLHKEVAVFLHEWAHTLGGFHERSPQGFLAPMYDGSQSAFSEASARLIRIGLSHRDSAAAYAAWAQEYRAEAQRDGAVAWDSATLKTALATAQHVLVEGPQRATMPPADAAVLQRAVALESAQDYGRAQLALQPLVERYPSSDEVQDLSCALAQKRGARVEEIVAACRKAARLPDAPSWILLSTAHALLSSGGRAEAMPLLDRAESKLGDDAGSLLYLAQLQFEAGACSAAESTAARAKGIKGADRVTEECARLRHFVGFPAADAKLPAAQEAEYVSSALAAHRSIEARKLDQARATAAVLRQSFPQAPAAAVIECRAAARGSALAAVKTACDAAATQAPDAFYPQYSLGLVASAERRWTDADAALQRALRLDDSAPQVWQSLSAVKEKTGDLAGFHDLQRRFQERFKSPLHPALWPAGWKAH